MNKERNVTNMKHGKLSDLFYVIETRTGQGVTSRSICINQDHVKEIILDIARAQADVKVSYIKKVDLVTEDIIPFDFYFEGLTLKLKPYHSVQQEPKLDKRYGN